jgi:hypothetical protein
LALLVVASIFLILPARISFAGSERVQTPINIYIDIWTNKGGQGLYQYGGSYNIGEKITIYMTLRTGGYAVVVLCYQSVGENCHEYDSGYIAPRDVVTLGPDSVQPPSGKQYFTLQVCQIAGGSSSNCPNDYTWIDAGGQTTVQTASPMNTSEPTYATNTVYRSFTSSYSTSITQDSTEASFSTAMVARGQGLSSPIVLGILLGTLISVPIVIFRFRRR